MKGHLASLVLALALAAAAVVYRRPLLAWFGGPGAGGPAATAPAHDHDHAAAGAPAAGDDAVSYYTCPMHPSVRREVEGACPLCGMDLVPVTRAEEQGGVVQVDEARRAAVGIRTSPVIRGPMTVAVRAVGRVTYDERRLTDVVLRVGGYVSKLRVATTGQAVTKGETLFTLYSPDLYAAQEEYLLARAALADAGARGDGLVRAAEKKLRLWGLSAAQIARVAARGEPIEDVAFPSPASGVVLDKMIVEGDAVEPGMRLFRIAALDRIWVEAELYEADLRHVARGQLATVELSYLPGRTFTGKVAFIYPYLDPATRTGRVRVELPNRGLELKPDMYATVALAIPLGERVQVPIDAVIYTGPRRLVFVDIGGGKLEPRAITIGAQTDDLVEVVSGLAGGERVVTAGNFLVAAESRLRGATTWTDDRADP